MTQPKQIAGEPSKECRYELFTLGKSHYCHLPREHEGEHEWFYSREQVARLLDSFAAQAITAVRDRYLETLDCSPRFLEWLNQRIAALEQVAGKKVER